MRLVSKLALGTLGAAALAGGAIAAEQEMHVMQVPLADGTVVHIRYAGDKKPQIAVVPAGQPAQHAPIVALRAPGAAQMQLDPIAARFAAMDAMFADMDRQMDAAMRQAAAMRQQAGAAQANGQPMMVSTGSVPAGAVSYSVVTTSNGKCSRTVETSYTAAGQAPRVVEKTAGDCGSAAPAPAPRAAPSARPAPAAAPKVAGRNDA